MKYLVKHAFTFTVCIEADSAEQARQMCEDITCSAGHADMDVDDSMREASYKYNMWEDQTARVVCPQCKFEQPRTDDGTLDRCVSCNHKPLALEVTS